MAKARTTRPTPQPTNGQSEVDYIADRLVDKVWQGNEDRRGIATQAASVALAAIQDYTASRYMETADEFTGQQLVQRWLNREARASVALDGETQSVEGAYTRKPSELQRRRAERDPNLLGKFLAKQVEDGAEIAGKDEFEGNWRDDL